MSWYFLLMETEPQTPPPEGMTEDEFYAWADED
jgi:hypothetical protein